MFKKIKQLVLILLGLSVLQINAQIKVGDNPNTINTSALLEMESTSKGLLPTRMTSTQRDAINNPATGLIIYNMTAACVQLNIGTSTSPIWRCMSGTNSSSNGTSEVSVFGASPCSANSINGIMTTSVPVSGVTMTLNVNVTQIGTWNITVGPSNGVTFTGSGTFTSLGCQAITLTASGTPTSSGSTTWTTNTTPSGTATATVASLSTSSGGSAVVSSWTSTVGCSIGAGNNNSPAGERRGGVEETMVMGIAAPSTAIVTLVANVTTSGTYNISTNTINGVLFAASGTFSSTGNHTVVLTPRGTPIYAGNFMWNTTLSPSINIYGSVITTSAPLGITYNTHFNGIISGAHNTTNTADPTYFTLSTYSVGETFNSNSTCQNKPISAQGCGGLTSVRSSSGRAHNLININGQCWLQTNLNNIPTVYSGYNTSSWTNSSPGDQGYWGYSNQTTTNGSAGWQSTENSSYDGLLYQWCGAMNATISERSQGICPAGFHIPSDCEWMYLEHGQGMILSQQNVTGMRSNTTDNEGTPGYKLRSQGTGQTNTSGFSALLSGYRSTNGTFINYASNGSFNTSTSNGINQAFHRSIDSGFRGVFRGTVDYKYNAFSVRCLKD